MWYPKKRYAEKGTQKSGTQKRSTQAHRRCPLCFPQKCQCQASAGGLLEQIPSGWGSKASGTPRGRLGGEKGARLCPCCCGWLVQGQSPFLDPLKQDELAMLRPGRVGCGGGKGRARSRYREQGRANNVSKLISVKL